MGWEVLGGFDEFKKGLSFLGRVTARKDYGFVFKTRPEELNEELEVLNAESRVLEARKAENVGKLLEE